MIFIVSKEDKTVLAIVFAVIIVIALFSSYTMIGAGERGVLMDFGKVRDDTVLSPGLHFIVPIYNSVAKVNVQTLVYSADATAASKDLQDARTKVALNYHIEPNSVNFLYRDVGLNYETTVISPAIQEVVKASTAKYNAEELITQRSSVKDAIQNGLIERLNSRGIVIEQVSITDFAFSDQFSQAIEQKVTAQQLALKAENDLQRIKIEAQQKVAQAEGDRNATIAQAQGNAAAIDIINKQLEKSPQYVNYLTVTKWDGKLPQVTGSGIPLVNIPATTK